MSDSHFPKVSITTQMEEWRHANAELRAEMLMEHTFKIGNAVSDLQESRRRHHLRISALEDRPSSISKTRDPEDSASFVLNEHELEKAKEALREYKESDVWIKRLWIGGVVTVLTALTTSGIFLLLKVLLKVAVL